ncbi:HAD family hydrolase [Rhodoblastus sphagnicola]|uniref:HAD family hydrolase n=1 Tax=Rhodoblastus sphagnicola TaxID=333368 RepID=A0A2S6N834_9HYPH|nr:HAD-IA family hydrolase [Rhodoblastus sphagnicola]MBB4197769.1 phosphoglycolate phosphatase [Rhodoblastus sphagnicola]PPQ30757.1 HAD family hydrolase [Rhodoblastus sphagnicola]
MTYSLVIFDLDGTLADSFPWFTRHVNAAAEKFGFRRVENFEALRHADFRETFDRLEVPRWKWPAIARHMRQVKTLHLHEIALFAGVEPMLRALSGAGVRLALVSSDSEANARRQLGALADLFSQFDCGASVFGKARKFRRVTRLAGVAPDAVLSIGDEIRDIEAARDAGIACGAVCWGYAAPEVLRTREPDFIFTRIDDIVEALLKSA